MRSLVQYLLTIFYKLLQLQQIFNSNGALNYNAKFNTLLTDLERHQLMAHSIALAIKCLSLVKKKKKK